MNFINNNNNKQYKYFLYNFNILFKIFKHLDTYVKDMLFAYL